MGQDLPYRLRKPFLSSPEVAFWRVLQEMMGDRFIVCPKVALTDLFHVLRPNENVHFYSKIFRKNIDFLLVDPESFRPLIAIEMLHILSQQEERERDRFLAGIFEAAHFPLVRVPLAESYEMEDILELFQFSFQKLKQFSEEGGESSDDSVPLCPKCGLMMVLRIHRNGPQAGQQYYGCMNSPTCDGVVALSS